jgi:hypothetical protein
MPSEPRTGGCLCRATRYAVLTALWGVRPDRPALATVYAGTLDDSAKLVPAGHIWTRSAQPWIRIPDDVYRHEMQPADMAELLRAAKARAG